MTDVIVGDAALAQVATGFIFTKGPIWHPQAQHLTFSEMPGYIMRRWSAGDGVETFRQPCNKANGNACDQAGRMLTCEHASSSTSSTEADGTLHLIADDFGQPNGLYFNLDHTRLFMNHTDKGHVRVFDVAGDNAVTGSGVWAPRPPKATDPARQTA